MINMEQPDEYYIGQVLKGNTSAFEYLVKKYQDMVFGLALKMLKNHEDAEEMVQDSFVKAFRSLNSYRQESRFSTWLYRITYNGCITLLRKRKVEIRSLDESNLKEQDEQKIHEQLNEVNQEEMVRYLHLALSKLPEVDQVLITLHYYEDQKVEDVSQITGLSESNVKVRIHRARRRMYELMNYYLKEELINFD